jgi:hypothetical protein
MQRSPRDTFPNPQLALPAPPQKCNGPGCVCCIVRVGIGSMGPDLLHLFVAGFETIKISGYLLEEKRTPEPQIFGPPAIVVPNKAMFYFRPRTRMLPFSGFAKNLNFLELLD